MKNPPIIKWVSCMIIDAIEAKKSEISFTIQSPPRFMMDGKEIVPDSETTKRMINRLKIMSKLTPMIYSELTHGEIKLRAKDKDYDICSSFLDSKDNQECILKIKR